jgi:hypothetical protein
MKKFMTCLILLFSFSAFAESCKLEVVVALAEDNVCETLRTNLAVSSFENCVALAKKIKEDRFFGILNKEDQISRISLTFAHKKEEIEIDSTICL